MMDRLECFNVAAANVLQRLLEAFPEPVILDSRALQEELARVYPDCAIRGGPGHPGHSLASWTVRYLMDEGFIRSSGDGRGVVFPECTLTSKGFSALNRTLDALEPKPTLGRRILDAGKIIAPEVAGAIVTRLLSP
jgi:hypothetical protein